MRVMIVVHNLNAKNSHLMPWRTVCEIVKCMREDEEEAFLLSLGESRTELKGGLVPKGTKEISKNRKQLTIDLGNEIERINPDIIFWPVAWREPEKRIETVTSFNKPVVLWFPGGVYSLSACLYAIKVVGIRNTLPYLFESLSNKKKKVGYFKKYDVKAIFAMTETTKDCAVLAGWPETKTLVTPPGKEIFINRRKLITLPEEFKNWLEGKPYFLFMGPPSGIRGIFELLNAFDLAAIQNREIRLVCLFRSDGLLDSQKVTNIIDRCKHKDRIYTVWKSLGAEELNSFMAECHAVVLPFVMVPSEIPLAIIEGMAWGKPIITSSPGGTGDFVKRFGLSPMVGDIEALASAMVRLHEDHEFYKDKCEKTVAQYASHPDWQSVSRQWVEAAQCAVFYQKNSIA